MASACDDVKNTSALSTLGVAHLIVVGFVVQFYHSAMAQPLPAKDQAELCLLTA